MKKFALMLLLAVTAFSFAPSARANETAEKLALYIPNRIVDMFDLFSVSLGFGPKAQAELMCTRMVGAGFSVGVSANLYKDCNRQYGWGLQNGWHWQLPGMMQEDIERVRTSRLVKGYWESFIGMPSPEQKIYAFNEGARDYWQIGGGGGALVTADVYVNPVEWVDFALGFLFFDLKDDDFTFDDFQ
jgi:hypothetical protein